MLRKAEQEYAMNKELISQAASRQAEGHLELNLVRMALAEQSLKSEQSKLKTASSLWLRAIPSKQEPRGWLEEDERLRIPGGERREEQVSSVPGFSEYPKGPSRLRLVVTQNQGKAESRLKLCQLCQFTKPACQHSGHVDPRVNCVRRRPQQEVPDDLLCNVASPEGGASSSGSARPGLMTLGGTKAMARRLLQGSTRIWRRRGQRCPRANSSQFYG